MTDGAMHRGLERAARRMGEREAIRAGDRSWTFAELDARSNGFARYLAGQGVSPGSRVALVMANRVEFLMAAMAVSKLGAASVMVSPAWKQGEVAHAVALTEPVHAVADADTAPLMAGAIGERAVTDLDGGSAPEEGAGAPPQAVQGHAESVLVFSSGTTGMPKAVRHTHDSIGAATAHWVAALGLGPEDRFQVATPPSHILGLLNLLAAVSAGAMVRLHRRFDLDEELACIERERMTIEMAVAPIALAMANHPRLEDYDLSSLRYIMWGATPVSEHVARTVSERSGVRWLPAYGASEFPVLSCNPVGDPAAWRLDSAGLPPSGVELRVRDAESGEVLERGGIGEIQARGPSAMSGYLPESDTAAAFTDGWYRTGDVGWIEEEGWVHLTDRLKEMIKVSGFQVAPAELETVLHGHPAVLDCAVFGIPDERVGEVPVAAVKLDPAVPVSDGELERTVAEQLASYKQLRHVVVVDDIPRLPSGKVLRRTLRDEWAPAFERVG